MSWIRHKGPSAKVAALLADPAGTARAWDAAGHVADRAAQAWDVAPKTAARVADALGLERRAKGRPVVYSVAPDFFRACWLAERGVVLRVAAALGWTYNTTKRFARKLGCVPGREPSRVVQTIGSATELGEAAVRDVLVFGKPPTALERRLLAPWLDSKTPVRDLVVERRARKRSELIAERCKLSALLMDDRERMAAIDVQLARLDLQDARYEARRAKVVR